MPRCMPLYMPLHHAPLQCSAITVCCAGYLQVLAATFRIKDPEEKLKARQEALAGSLGDKLKLMSKLLVSRRPWMQEQSVLTEHRIPVVIISTDEL